MAHCRRRWLCPLCNGDAIGRGSRHSAGMACRLLSRTERPVEVERRADERKVRERLREISKRLAAEAEAKLADFVARRTKSAEEKIAQAESQAEAEVRAAAAEAATKAAETILRSQMAGGAGETAFASGLNEVRAKLN